MPAQALDDEFSAFMRAHARMLWRAAWGLCGDRSGADDLAQSGLIAAWREWPKIRLSNNPEAYAYRSMVNAHLRDRRRQRWAETPMSEMSDIGANDVAPTIETREVLRQALLKLSPRQRSVLILRYLVDLPERQVAEVLGCSTGAVKSHTSRAINALRLVPGLHEALQRIPTDE